MKNFEVQHTIRLYDPKLIAEIGRTFEIHKNDYNSKNEFLTDLLRLGLKAMNNTPPTAPAGAMAQPLLPAMSELKDIKTITDDTSKYLTTQFKKLYIHITLIERILSSVYNMQLGDLSGSPLQIKKVEDGFFDDLPTRFEKIILTLESLYGLK